MDKALRAIVNARYDKYVSRIVYRLRRVPAKDWEGDDSQMRTLWDFWKWELQETQCVLHDLIEEMVEQQVRCLVQELPHEEGALLTLLTYVADELDENESNGPIFEPDAVAAELMARLNERAVNEPHRREVQRVLDDEALDRFQRDIEPYW